MMLAIAAALLAAGTPAVEGRSADQLVAELFKSGCVELPVTFAGRSATPSNASAGALDQAGKALASEADLRVRVVVRAHKATPKALELAKRRADAVRAALLERSKAAPARLLAEAVEKDAQLEGCRDSLVQIINVD